MAQNNSEKFWLVIGDIHDAPDNINNIPDLAQAAGLIISGDLTNEGNGQDAEKILQRLDESGLPVYAQLGNMDLLEVDAMLTEKNINLHHQLKKLNPEVVVFGVGGSTPTPMNTPTEFPESSYAQWLEEVWQEAKKYPFSVLISHNPPKNTACDIVGDNIHVGSQAVRDFIEKKQPDVCICGHIHESRAEDKIGRTRIVNPGAFAEGGYVKLVLGDDGVNAILCQVER